MKTWNHFMGWHHVVLGICRWAVLTRSSPFYPLISCSLSAADPRVARSLLPCLLRPDAHWLSAALHCQRRPADECCSDPRQLWKFKDHLLYAAFTKVIFIVSYWWVLYGGTCANAEEGKKRWRCSGRRRKNNSTAVAMIIVHFHVDGEEIIMFG